MLRSPLVFAGLTILIVESEPSASEIFGMLVEVFGAKFHAEPAMDSALAYLQVAVPDCIFCNVNLSDGSGYTFVERLRELEVTRGIAPIPTIAVFQSLKGVNPQHPLEAGFQSFMTQPWTLQAIIDTVLQLMGKANLDGE